MGQKSVIEIVLKRKTHREGSIIRLVIFERFENFRRAAATLMQTRLFRVH